MENGVQDPALYDMPESQAADLGLLLTPMEAAAIRVRTADGVKLVNTLDCLKPTTSTGDYQLTPSRPFGMDVAMQLVAIRGRARQMWEDRLQEARLELAAVRERATKAETSLEGLRATHERLEEAHRRLGEACQAAMDQRDASQRLVEKLSRHPLSSLRQGMGSALKRLAKAVEGP